MANVKDAGLIRRALLFLDRFSKDHERDSISSRLTSMELNVIYLSAGKDGW